MKLQTGDNNDSGNAAGSSEKSVLNERYRERQKKSPFVAGDFSGKGARSAPW
jgi:hypothetical protein